MKYLFILLSSFIFIMTNAWAADEAVIQDLQSDVTATKGKADKNVADINSLKGGLPAERDARIAADADLQGQIDDLQGQIDNIPITTPTPPTITHNAPSTTVNFTIDISITISDDVELSHYVINNETVPSELVMRYFRPGVSHVTSTHTFELQSGTNEFLVTAVDTEGTTAKEIISIFQECMDCDGDGYISEAYGGDDCDDSNSFARPGSLFWGDQPLSDGSFDYNCDGVEELQYTAFASCFSDCLSYDVFGTCTDYACICSNVGTNLPGWWAEESGVIPACGEEGQVGTYGERNDLCVLNEPPVYHTQRCR